MAVTNREQQMLDLVDEGYSFEQIADRMGIKAATVMSKVTALDSGGASDRAREAAIAQGSRNLLAAICVAYPAVALNQQQQALR